MAETLALLVGVPSTIGDFVNRARALDSDYLLQYRPTGDDDNPEASLHAAWHARYGPIIGSPLSSLLETCSRLGLTAWPCATLDDVRTASTAHRVVVVLTHWKGSDVLFDDVSEHCTVSDVAGRVRSCDSPLSRWLLERIDPPQSWWGKLRRRKLGSRALSTLLHDAVNNGPDTDASGDGLAAPLALRVTGRASRRDELDRILHGLIQPGNRIELFDGLHSPHTFAQAIDSEFAGLLDLAACTSTVLGDYVGRSRRGRLRVLQFADNQDFMWQAHCLAVAFEQAALGRMDYADARWAADAALRAALNVTTPRGTSNRRSRGSV